MNKRLIIKTAFICFGIFILLCTAALWLFLENYEIDREKKFQVVVAKVPIQQGIVINDTMLGYKTIKESAFNEFMVMDLKEVTGTKAIEYIGPEDYIRNYILLPREKWYEEDERAIILPMEVEERLANLIRGGSFIDIKYIPKEGKSVPQLVLVKIRVEDVLDENGVSLGSNGVNKKAYAKVVLNQKQRDRLYVARETGKLLFELYCDTTQNPPEEEFQIPWEYLKNSKETPKGG